MSVANLVRAKEDEAFSYALGRLIAAQHLSPADVCRKAFGLQENGNPSNTTVLSNILKNKRRPHDNTIRRLSSALGVSFEAMISWRDGPVADLVTDKPNTPVIKTGQDKQKALNTPATPPDQFALTIDHRGMATLRLNMVDVPMAVAMQALAALTGAGLLSTKDEPKP